MNRRTLLAGTVGALGLSGCLSAEADGETTLGGLVILSYSTEQTLVDLRIDWEGETVHDSTYTIEPDGAEDGILYDGAVPERSWPDEPG